MRFEVDTFIVKVDLQFVLSQAICQMKSAAHCFVGVQLQSPVVEVGAHDFQVFAHGVFDAFETTA